MATMNRGQEKGSKAAETFLIESDTSYSLLISSNEKAWDSLTRIYCGAKASELEASYTKTGRSQAEMFRQG